MVIGRILLRSISNSDKLANLKTDGARLLYTWLIPRVDIEGRYYADPRLVKAKVFPLLNKKTRQIAEYLQDLAVNKLILVYKAGDNWYLWIPDFKDRQPYLREDREAKSTIPAPTIDDKKNNSGVAPEFPGSSPEFPGLNVNVKVKDKVNVKVNGEGENYPDVPGIPGSGVTAFAQQFTKVRDPEVFLRSQTEAFPGIDLKEELRKMIAWYEANPEKRKKNISRFIHNWLSRAGKGGNYGHDKGRAGSPGREDPVKPAPGKYSGVGKELGA
jgi:hypothetical protein